MATSKGLNLTNPVKKDAAKALEEFALGANPTPERKDAEDDPYIKVTVNLRQSLLATIDAITKSKDQTRKAWITAACYEKLERDGK
ncbi:hypothetical protein VPH49_22080 [Pseudomonas luteola]|uniref:hypothetical protein n=1 Tax=Pseudomonas luteola TaxID=47886 RepID=UPI003A8AC7E7